MTQHVWLEEPTQLRALIYLYSFLPARNRGATIEQAMAFAVYLMERNNQDGPIPLRIRLTECIKSNWSIMKEPDTENYLDGFKSHIHLMLNFYIQFLKEDTNLTYATWYVIADWYEERGQLDKAEEIRTLFTE